MILRDYQVEMLSRLERAWESHRSVMVQMPTGTGKTVLMGEAIRRAGSMTIGAFPLGSGGVLVVAHRRELIEQIRGTIAALGIPASLVRVESIQKLAREIGSGEPGARRGQSPCAPSLVIVDEAHHALAKTYRMLWERWPEAKFLGLTATPCRLSGEAFTDLFEVLLQAEPIQWFIDKGWLSDFEYVSAAPDNPLLEKVRGLRKRGADGDYQTKEMVSVMDVPESISHLFETYREFAWGKKGIVYAIDIEHARHIAAFYSSKGVRCAVIDSKTPARERERLVEAYRSTHGVRHLCDIASDITEMPDPSVPPIDVLVNVDIFSEGFDCPEVEFIQLARPTLSLNKYLQQVGRGMRVSKGKPHVLILDNVGLYHTFGLPTDEQDWRLMFLGKQAGKGVAERQEPMLVVDLEAGQRELVNLEMVRVKRRGEIRRGVEVFMQGGKYGVMMDGKMTCPPEFERVTRLADGGNYFALATYPYYLYRNRQTVIDSRGVDLKASLYGNVTREEDFFCAKDIQGNRVFFDGIGRKAYREKPHTTKFRYVDLVEKGGGRYALRRQLPGISPFDFRLDDILYNDHLVIVKDVLMVKGDTEHVYKIVGYQNDYILAGQSIYKNLQLIYYNGKLGRQAMLYQLPEGVRFEPDRQALHVRRVVRL